jgi:hypothetical protein
MAKNTTTRRSSRGRSTGAGTGDDVPKQKSLFDDFLDGDDRLVPSEVIRTETVLSRMPIHILSKEDAQKKAAHEISIVERDERGLVTLRWEVSFNQKFGAPGQLAYKIDTLVINRAIYEAGRPVPEVIRLGSLRELSEIVDLGTNTNKFKLGLRQNAGAYITADVKYRAASGEVLSLEADFVRYTPVFTGDKLPSGKMADAVYIVLSRQYRNVLNSAPNRPLDFRYMKDLPPMAQRFYEIASYKVFAALKNGLPCAQLPYSEFCIASNQTRYATKEKMQKQMYKVLKPHTESRYIESYWYEDLESKKGEPDWIICIKPGRRAIVEFRTFNRKQAQANSAAARRRGAGISDPALHDWLVAALVERDVRPKRAKELVATMTNDDVGVVKDKLEYFDWMRTSPRNQKNVENWPGLLITILGDPDFEMPSTFVTSRMREEWDKAEQRREEEINRESRRLLGASDDEIDRLMRGLPSHEVEKLRREAIVTANKAKGYSEKTEDERSALIEKAFRALVRKRVRTVEP